MSTAKNAEKHTTHKSTHADEEPKDTKPSGPVPAGVQDQINHGGLPADDPRRADLPETETQETRNEKLLGAEHQRQEDAEKAKG